MPFFAYAQGVDTMLIVSKHAEGMSLRYGVIVGELFDEMGVLHVVEPGVEEADLGNYGQSEE